MTKASFCLLGALPPRGSAVRVKSRFFQYSVSCDSAVAADFGREAAYFELARLAVWVVFFGIDVRP